ncbi:MAG: hypothetical protein V4665_03690 [Patescibacteria group bacterium]
MINKKIVLIGDDQEEKQALSQDLVRYLIVENKESITVFSENTPINNLIEFICENKTDVIIIEPEVSLAFVGEFAEKAWSQKDFFMLYPLVAYYDYGKTNKSAGLAYSLLNGGVWYSSDK